MDRHAGRRERVVQRGGRLTDQVDRSTALPHRRGQRRVVRALPAAAGDQVHATFERADPDLGRRDVRRLRVVDVQDAADRGDLLEPVRDAGERARDPRAPPAPRSRARGRPPPPPSRSCGCAGPGYGSRRRPSAARRARAACRRGVTDRARAPRPRPGRVRRGSPNVTRVAAPPASSRSQPGGHDGERPGRLAGEDLELRGSVVVKGPVAVEVVLGQVQQHRGLRRERLGVLELERRCLAHDRRRTARASRAATSARCPRCPRPSPADPPRGKCGRSARPSSSCRSSP